MARAQRLTQGFVNGASPTPGRGRERYWDAQVPGLALVMTAKGARSYCVVYRDRSGRQREPRIGDARIITLKQARTAALEILAKAQLEGRDPIAQRRAAHAEEESRRSRTFGKLADAYFADSELRKAASRIALEKGAAGLHLLPRYQYLPVFDISAEQIANGLREVAVSSGFAAANTTLEVVRQMLQFACSRDWIDKNVALGLAAFPKTSRERVATDAELSLLWRRCEEAKTDGRSDGRPTALAIQFALFTLQRRSEVAGLNFREVDWVQKVWVVPGPRTKNKKGPHVVPLSEPAIALLKDAFAGRSNGFAFVGRDGAALNPKVMTRAVARMTEELGIDDLTVHDLRRTGATRLTERLGVLGEVVSRILNHTPPGPSITLVYNRNTYLPHKREALTAWAREVERITACETREPKRSAPKRRAA